MKQLVISVILALMAVSATPAKADPVGEWRVGDGSATVRIRKCGAALCGHVASTRSAPGKDEKNPDPAKRNRSVLGIEVLSNLRPAGPSAWSGTSYNAEDGQTYATQMTMQDESTLLVKGCVPHGGLCGSETWTRVR